MSGWAGMTTEARLLRLEEARIQDERELEDFKKEVRERLDRITQLLISILVAIIVGMVVAVGTAAIGGFG